MATKLVNATTGGQHGAGYACMNLRHTKSCEIPRGVYEVNTGSVHAATTEKSSISTLSIATSAQPGASSRRYIYSVTVAKPTRSGPTAFRATAGCESASFELGPK
ncbi:unnamed protein product, partial [Iphiclides podalirius]